MQSNTKTAVRAILATDGTISPKQIERAMAILAGKEGDALSPIVRPKVAAAMLGVCTMTIRRWTKQGVLTPVYSPVSRTCKGYTQESVARLLNGEVPRPDAVTGEDAGEDAGKDAGKDAAAPLNNSKKGAFTRS